MAKQKPNPKNREKLLEIMRLNDLTIPDVAEMLSVSESTVSSWRTEKGNPVHGNTILVLNAILDEG